MPQPLTKEDLNYSHHAFWYFYISTFMGSDDEKEINLDEAIDEVINIKDFVTNFEEWYSQFLPEEKANEDGIFENPKTIEGKISSHIHFTVELHLSEITYFLNNTYIGELSGHFQAWFLTWEELLACDKGAFLPLLPMVGVEKEQRKEAEETISKALKQIPLYQENSVYIAQCIVNGLVMNDPFLEDEQIGTINTQNHSMRNVNEHASNKEKIIALNLLLKKELGE